MFWFLVLVVIFDSLADAVDGVVVRRREVEERRNPLLSRYVGLGAGCNILDSSCELLQLLKR